MTKRHVSHHHAHTIAKTVSYRLLSTVETAVIAWILTGSWHVTIAFSALEAVARIPTYYGHERLWVWINRRFK